jgi:predicted nucleotide-binding protein
MSILLLLKKDSVQQQIAKRVDGGQNLLNEPIQSPEDLRRIEQDRIRWHQFNIDLLKRLFSEESIADEYGTPIRRVYYPDTFAQAIQTLHRDMESYINRLRSIMERTELYEVAPTVNTPEPTATVAKPVFGDAVFIVHGHSGREIEVAQAVKDLGLRPVILKNEPMGGSPTLIEKLEREAKGCGYAVVLFTPDDRGKASTENKYVPRARQNVILELGYFVALLGRDRVTIFNDPSVEVPSDFHGVGFYELDSNGGWKARLAGELDRVGLGPPPEPLKHAFKRS